MSSNVQRRRELPPISNNEIGYLVVIFIAAGCVITIPLIIGLGYGDNFAFNSEFLIGNCTVIGHRISNRSCTRECTPYPCQYPCYEAFAVVQAISDFSIEIYHGLFQSMKDAKTYLNENFPINSYQVCYYNKKNFRYIIFELKELEIYIVIAIVLGIILFLALVTVLFLLCDLYSKIKRIFHCLCQRRKGYSDLDGIKLEDSNVNNHI